MRVLVTGGAGFIGSHIVDELLDNKYDVIVVDNLSTGKKTNLPTNIKFYEMDINDPGIESVFEKETPDSIIHLAAQASVSESMKNPYFDFSTNADGTVKLLLLAKKYTVAKFVFASTAAVYGDTENLPIEEGYSLNPKSFYAMSKYTAEAYIHFFNSCIGLNTCTLRFSNVYGPRQNPNGEAGVVSIFIDRLLKKEDLVIYGGSQTRDFIYVKDIARACRAALTSEFIGTLNISSSAETSINNLFSKVVTIVGEERLPIYMPKRVGEIGRSMLDNRNAIEELGWQIHYSLDKGLNETCNYFSKLYNAKVEIV